MTHRSIYFGIGILVWILLSYFTRWDAFDESIQEMVVDTEILGSAELDAINQSYDKVKPIFQRACYDCHSDHTKIPIYGYLFPINLYLQDHVAEGRENLNFSQWGKYSAKKRANLALEIVKEIEEESMPPFNYKLLHSQSIIDSESFEKLKKWQEEQDRYYENSQK